MNLLMIAVTTFISCTECSQEARDFLNIPADVKCEMISWKLNMSGDNTYRLSAQWSYYADNRTLLKTGEIANASGSWTTDGGVYTLTLESKALYLLKLNANIFQILSKDKKIVPGGEGFANTLNRTAPVGDKSMDFPRESNDRQTKDMILTGRTPLKPFDKLLGITDKEDHDKIKWLLKLRVDGALEVRRTLEHPADYKGNWSVTDNVYKLDFENHTLYLLRASNDVYYFMTPGDGLLVGNQEFGMSLIRRPSPSGQ